MSIFTIAIHGGAGTILKKDLTPQQERDYLEALNSSLEKGYQVLAGGGSAIDAVQASVVALEDHILFNAGRGSVFTNGGNHEMDAAVMNGADLTAGAVAGVSNIRNPVSLAAKIMEDGHHVFLTGAGAMAFAKEHGIKTEPDEYFFSPLRFAQWKSVCETDKVLIDHTNEYEHTDVPGKKMGTVGAVACDAAGNIAAATSTGGMTNKRVGRIGDSPVIGAGTYANNKTCAVSCTGHGELFLRAVAAYDVSCLMEYAGLSLQDAMQKVVMDKLVKIGGEGGMIGVDASGDHAMLFNSEGMYRAVKNSKGLHLTKIYND